MHESMNQSETGLEPVIPFPFRREIVAVHQVLGRVGFLGGFFCLFVFGFVLCLFLVGLLLWFFLGFFCFFFKVFFLNFCSYCSDFGDEINDVKLLFKHCS